MRKPIYFLILLLMATSCMNNNHTEESTEENTDTTAIAPASSMIDTTTSPGAGITAVEVVIEVKDSKSKAGIENATVSIMAGDKTIAFNATDIPGKYFTMEEVGSLTGIKLKVSKEGYAELNQDIASGREMPSEVLLTAGK